MTKYGYTIGGSTPLGISDITERYDDVANSWSYKGTLINPTTQTSSGFSLGSNGYITGGNLSTLQTVMFDDAIGWTAKNNMLSSKLYHAGFSLKGYGYAIAGYYNYSNTQKYDGNVWSNIAVLPHNRYFNCGFSSNTYGYTLGNSIGWYAITERYDDLANLWTSVDALTSFEQKLTSFYLNGYGYATTGGITYRYDETNQLWSGVPNGGYFRSELTGFELNNYGYAVGGIDGAGVITAHNKRYDDVGLLWTSQTSMSTPRKYLTSFSYDIGLVTCPPLICNLSII